jgi:hypothetical protein
MKRWSAVSRGIYIGRKHSRSRRRIDRRLSFRVCDDLIDGGHEIVDDGEV